MSQQLKSGFSRLSVAASGDFVVVLPCRPQDDCAVHLSRAQLARIMASFDVLDRVGPQFRLSDRVSVEIQIDEAGESSGRWRPQTAQLCSADGQLSWLIRARRGEEWRESQDLPIAELLQFQPALRCRCAVLVNTTNEQAALATVAHRLQADLQIIELGPMQAKVGFVDEHQFARSVDVVRGQGVEACKISFELVLKIENLEQAGRAAALELIAAALERGVPHVDSPQIIGLSQPSHCVLTVSHAADPARAHFAVLEAEPAALVG